MKNKIYSPIQTGTGAFFGGPIAGIVFLRDNFKTLSKPELAKKSLYFGILITIVLLSLLPFLPEKFPNYVIPMFLGITARMIAEKYQLTKQGIAESKEFEFHSNWRVFGFSLLFAVLFIGVGFAYILLLTVFGVQF